MSIKVLIVDDSAVVREVLSQILGQAADIDVIDTCPDPIFAQQKMTQIWPDVIVLDIEMPRMDGLTFLRKIMAERPTPVVICSSLTEKGTSTALDAMSYGAVAIITKPNRKLKDFLEESTTLIVQEVRAAAASRMEKVRKSTATPSHQTGIVSKPLMNVADALLTAPAGQKNPSATDYATDFVIAVGTSTGGTQALEYLLPRLPATTPGMVVVQHMPEQFTASFARRLDQLCQVDVKEARSGDAISRGTVLIAPGNKHLMIKKHGKRFMADVKDGPLVSRHRPSVDVLFRSVAVYAGARALGLILTGMGDDGARGMREMYDAGAHTIAQDEESCVVFGMPKVAIAYGGVNEVMSLDAIATKLSIVRM